MDVSTHAKKRLHERMGVNKKSSERVAQNALKSGIKRQDFSGSIRRFLDMLYFQYMDKEIIVYSNKVFVFAGDILVTVMDLPSRYNKVCAKVGNKEG